MKRITGPQTPVHIYEARLPGDPRIVVCATEQSNVLPTDGSSSSSSTKSIVYRSFSQMYVECTLYTITVLTSEHMTERASRFVNTLPDHHLHSTSRCIFHLRPVLTIHGIMSHTEIRRSVWERIGRLLGRRGNLYQERCITFFSRPHKSEQY